jgi:hypothetical protein
MKKTLSIIALVLATASVSMAGQAVSSKKVVVAPDDCRFRANEWQVDTSVVGAGGIYNNKSGGGVGGNLGVNYFFTKFIGVGLDDSIGGFWPTHNGGGQAVDSLQADLLVRYPICAWNLAPYLMVGGGASWGTASQGDGNIGGGIEYRVTPNVGLFADCRWLYGGATNTGQFSMALPRVGLRFAF